MPVTIGLEQYQKEKKVLKINKDIVKQILLKRQKRKIRACIISKVGNQCVTSPSRYTHTNTHTNLRHKRISLLYALTFSFQICGVDLTDFTLILFFTFSGLPESQLT